MPEVEATPTPEATPPPATSPSEPSASPEPAPATVPPASDPAASDPTSAEPSPSEPAPTLAEGGGTPDAETPQVAPAIFPDNWRELSSGGDQKTEQYLKRYASFGNVVKALMAQRAKISSGELLRSKPDGTDEQVLNEWRAQAGVPEKPEGYLEKLPDGLVIGDDDKPIVESFITSMHEDDAPPALVHKALGWYYAHQEKVLADRTESDRTERAQHEDTLHAEWGGDYRSNLNGAHAVFDTYAPEGLRERFFSARMADGSPLGDDPDTLRFLVALSREINPHGTITPAAGQTTTQTIEAELAQLNIEMADSKGKKFDYWTNPEKQARWRELDAALQRQKARQG